MTGDLFVETLPAKTAKLVAAFQKLKPGFLQNFYLSGGTALSLQIGHRQSEDLDFFNRHEFDPRVVETELKSFGKLDQTVLEKNTLNTFLDGVQLQFLGYQYQLLEPFADWNGIKLSSVIDIACTKLQTVGMRGSKKDFIDVFFLLDSYSLEELFTALEKKYTGISYNKLHIMKSLLYFNDADNQPMPRMHKKVAWEKVKETIINAVKKMQLS